jgi:hypothetical protein
MLTEARFVKSSPTRVGVLREEMNKPKKLRAPSIPRFLRNGWETTNLNQLGS